MVIIPYEKESIETSLSIEAIKKKLRLKISSKKQGFFSCSNKEFSGTVDDYGFLLIREKRIGFNSLLPIVIEATLEAPPKGLIFIN